MIAPSEDFDGTMRLAIDANWTAWSPPAQCRRCPRVAHLFRREAEHVPDARRGAERTARSGVVPALVRAISMPTEAATRHEIRRRASRRSGNPAAQGPLRFGERRDAAEDPVETWMIPSVCVCRPARRS
jgi:hypothetical protein